MSARVKTGELADDARANRQAKLDASYRRQMVQDLRNVVRDEGGRRFLSRLIYDVCGLWDPVWTQSAEIHYQAGRASIGADLLKQLEIVAPAETKRMIEERLDYRLEYRSAVERAETASDEE